MRAALSSARVHYRRVCGLKCAHFAQKNCALLPGACCWQFAVDCWPLTRHSWPKLDEIDGIWTNLDQIGRKWTSSQAVESDFCGTNEPEGPPAQLQSGALELEAWAQVGHSLGSIHWLEFLACLAAFRTKNNRQVSLFWRRCKQKKAAIKESCWWA